MKQNFATAERDSLKFYVSPEIDKVDVTIEAGFALSTNGGDIPDLNNNNYGDY